MDVYIKKKKKKKGGNIGHSNNVRAEQQPIFDIMYALYSYGGDVEGIIL